jgi:CcmD family protein
MDTRNFTFMFYGFASAWAVIVIYVITLAAREKKLREEMGRLRQMIESGDKR